MTPCQIRTARFTGAIGPEVERSSAGTADCPASGDETDPNLSGREVAERYAMDGWSITIDHTRGAMTLHLLPRRWSGAP